MRKSPIRHKVKPHRRKNRPVREHFRGKGIKKIQRIKRRIITKEELSKELIELSKTYNCNFKIIGGIRRRGFSIHDIDIMADKDLTDNISKEIGIILSNKFKTDVDVFVPMSKQRTEKALENPILSKEYSISDKLYKISKIPIQVQQKYKRKLPRSIPTVILSEKDIIEGQKHKKR